MFQIALAFTFMFKDDDKMMSSILNQVKRHPRQVHPRSSFGNINPIDINNLQPGLNNVKSNVRFHHQQRHTNGTIAGSFGQLQPNGSVKIVHYVKDHNGYREVETEEDKPQTVAVTVLKEVKTDKPANPIQESTTTTKPVEHTGHTSRRGITYQLDNQNFPIFSTPPSTVQVEPNLIMQSAAGAVQTYGKSPLFDKYYRPSPDEVQKSYEYHRLRTMQDPSSYRPHDPTPIPEVSQIANTKPEIKASFGGFQTPVTNVQYQDQYPVGYYLYTQPIEDMKHYNTQQYGQPVVVHSPQPQGIYPVDTYVQNQFPQSLAPQNPVFIQQQPFIAASMYSGPPSTNTATFNQPYPTNIPIYNQPVPQNIPTYLQPKPDLIPVYNQQTPENVPIYQTQAPIDYQQNQPGFYPILAPQGTPQPIIPQITPSIIPLA